MVAPTLYRAVLRPVALSRAPWRQMAPSGNNPGIDIVTQRFKINRHCLCTYEVGMRKQPEPGLFDGFRPTKRTEAVSNGATKHPRFSKTFLGGDAERIPFPERPTCTINEACNAVGLGRTKLYQLIGGGAVETLTIGRRRLVRVPSLLRLMAKDGQLMSVEPAARGRGAL